MSRSKLRETLVFCLGILLVGGLIQAAGWVRNDRVVFPEVSGILKAFAALLGDGRTWRKIWVTLRHLIEVLAVSTAAGLLVGVIEGVSDTIRTLLKPLMILLRAIPMIVMVIIVMVVLKKYDHVPLVASSLFLLPMISEAVCEGIRAIDPMLIDVYRMNSRLTPRVLMNVHLPLMAGYLKQGYVNAAGMGLKMVVSTEYLVQTRDSLGKAVYSSVYDIAYENIYAYALVMILLVLALTLLPSGLARLYRTFRANRI